MAFAALFKVTNVIRPKVIAFTPSCTWFEVQQQHLFKEKFDLHADSESFFV